MKLSEIFNQLTYGELSLVTQGTGDIDGVGGLDQTRVLHHINTALIELYGRFALKLGKVRVNLQTGQRSYLLEENFLLTSTSNEPVKYLDDSVGEPFTNEVFQCIERIYDDLGNELSLEEGSYQKSLFTLNTRTLVVPEDLDSVYVDVMYRAGHPLLVKAGTGWNPLNVEVELPTAYLQALLYYVAGRMANPKGVVNDLHEGNNYMALFEAECQRLDNRNLELSTSSENLRLCRNGWV